MDLSGGGRGLALFLLGDLGVREQYWKPGERRRSIPFPLDLKAQHGFWDQRSGTRRVGGPAGGRVGGGPGGARHSLFTQLDFPSKTRQAGPWHLAARPAAPPNLKIGDLFLYNPQRGGAVTLVLRDPGAAGSPCSFPEPSVPRRAQNLRAGLRPRSPLTVPRGLLAIVPGKSIRQS